jgi:exopolyphosphatase/guanosine-5'-triphosphate,3'-diphosphate pyrophosphatase
MRKHELEKEFFVIERYAAVDIGTNTILMIIGEKDLKGQLQIIRDEHSVARLGEGLNLSKKINDSAVLRAVEILEKYKKICDDLNVAYFDLVATSAMREAENSIEVLEKLNSIFTTPIRVITGEEEAHLSFVGTIEDLEPSLVIDIGGGSTELVYGFADIIKQRISLPIGAVKLTERFFAKLPPTKDEIQNATDFINNILNKSNFANVECKYYAVAGTPTTLAAMAQNLENYDENKVHKYVLTEHTLTGLKNMLSLASKNDILLLPGIHPGRADIITAGTLILNQIFKFLNTDSAIVSIYGLRYGVLKELFRSKNTPLNS